MKENDYFRIAGHPVAPHKLKKTARTFFCPGCKCNHWFDDTWKLIYNGEKEPSVTPSILARHGQYQKDGSYKRITCHFFIIKGKIKYLTDCTHDLAGTTIDMKKEE